MTFEIRFDMSTFLQLLLHVAISRSSPFKWDTVLDLSYTFCYNESGPYRADALAALSRTKLFIHGMNERQLEAPQYKLSERKVIASAKQLRSANPEQLQLYTIQNDFTRSIYASGDYFNAHPECMLRDKNGDLVNFTNTQQQIPECTQPNATGGNATCHVYGFNTKCGRDAWVKFAVDTVSNGSLDGVFIDGFQGCTPEGGCGRALATCDEATSTAWLAGLNETMWQLRAGLDAIEDTALVRANGSSSKTKKNKTIVCNGTGQMYDCGGRKPCWCDAANKERFYPNENDLAQVAAAANGTSWRGGDFWGIIHVPHIDAGFANFNKSLAGFLATAGGNGAAFGYGWGFQYDCEGGGWTRDFPELHKPLGPPAGPPKISNVTKNPTGRGSPTAVFSRRYMSGVRAFFNSTLHPKDSGSCIEWSDGSRTEAGGGCDQMDAAWASTGW